MTRSRIFLFAVLSMSLNARAAEPPAPDLPQPLSETIAALDSAVFDAFNRCAAPEQLAKHASYFAENVEFYHDTGGVTWNRADMLANTSRNACGKFTRELVPGSLAVFPIKDFGAIGQGSHRFCQTDASKCEGLADFTILWRHSGGRWEITRVLSYGHRPAAGSLLQPPSR